MTVEEAAHWYVNSRGAGRLDDYNWFPLLAGDAAELGRIRGHQWRGQTLDALVNDEKPGLLLAHDEALGTVVYVSCVRILEPRRDALNRPIRAAVLGVVPARSDPTSLVAVAAAALSRADPLQLAMSSDPAQAPGWTAQASAWTAIVEHCVAELGRDQPEQTSSEAELREQERRTGAWSGSVVEADEPLRREHVAWELSAMMRMAKFGDLRGRILVLRRPSLDQPEWQRLKPWRALTELVPSESESGTELESGAGLASLAYEVGTAALKKGTSYLPVPSVLKKHLFLSLTLLTAVCLTLVVIGTSHSPTRPRGPSRATPVATTHRPTPAPSPKSGASSHPTASTKATTAHHPQR